MQLSVSIDIESFRRGWTTLAVELQKEVFMYLWLPQLLVLADMHQFSSLAWSILLSRLREVFIIWDLPLDETFAMMVTRNTVMSGSVALYLAFIGCWFPDDLDFYCPAGEYEKVIEFFTRRSYVLQPTVVTVEPQQGYPDVEGIGEVATLIHAGLGVKINVIASQSASACTPIFFFHSTVVMNVITGTGVVCFYPELTGEMRAIRNHIRSPRTYDWKIPTGREAVALEKYKGRGYTISNDCGHWFLNRSASCEWCVESFRNSDDARLLRMPFMQSGEVHLTPAFKWKIGTLQTRRRNTILYEVPPAFPTRSMRHSPFYALPGDTHNGGPHDNFLSTVRVFEHLALRFPRVVVEDEDETSDWGGGAEPRPLVRVMRRID